MIFRQMLLPLILMGSLSSIYFLPIVGAVADSAVRMELPESVGDWSLATIPPSEAEIKTLGADTRFSKAICKIPRQGEMYSDGTRVQDQANLSVVLSGYDLNSSIHRPERCMPAQGHNITSSTDVKMTLPTNREFAAKRLLSVQRVRTGESDKDSIELNCVTYYFFVGHDQITNDHLTRTFIDMKDRLLRGMDQRWAYVSTSMWYGRLPWLGKEVSEAEADQKLSNFVNGFAVEQIDWQQIVH